MQLTCHATARSRQRGIPLDVIRMIVSYGTCVRKRGNAWEYRLSDRCRAKLIRDLKQMIQRLDKCPRTAILVDPQQREIITVYHTG